MNEEDKNVLALKLKLKGFNNEAIKTILEWDDSDYPGDCLYWAQWAIDDINQNSRNYHRLRWGYTRTDKKSFHDWKHKRR